MIDFHQDLFSAYFCGEGIPDWATTWDRKGIKPFPQPNIKENYTYDENHHPNRTQCLSKLFSLYYMTEQVGNLQECLFNATCNPFSPHNEEQDPSYSLQAEFIKYWSTVSKFFADNEFVLGYDLINEPVAGNIWEHPKNYLQPGKFEAEVMEPSTKM